jgi:valyl-tRNA synthetase
MEPDAMSYAQAEFIVRYQRMRGRNIFYPMGFDDNGLPTERYVEKTYGINKRKTTRKQFRELCLQVTSQGIAQYEQLWRALGLSVDWRLRYSTIDEHCHRTAQKSFLELYRTGRIYRSNEPVLWDIHFETALAQADLESTERKSKLHEVMFRTTSGVPLVIATTRPELIPACVALYCNPKDPRYKELIGKFATVPLFNREVPIMADQDVSTYFGTGLMMVCTFGDGEDVRRWKRDHLDIRLCIRPDGKMSELAGPYESLTIDEARKRILADLQSAGLHRGSTPLDQIVSVSERSGVPVEFVMAPQWFVKLLDLKSKLSARSGELRWFPEWMKVRLEHWIEGLKYDWNISRQRFYGVPFPVWFCANCNEVILANPGTLPIDPLEDPCPVSTCPNYGNKDLRGIRM